MTMTSIPQVTTTSVDPGFYTEITSDYSGNPIEPAYAGPYNTLKGAEHAAAMRRTAGQSARGVEVVR